MMKIMEKICPATYPEIGKMQGHDAWVHVRTPCQGSVEHWGRSLGENAQFVIWQLWATFSRGELTPEERIKVIIEDTTTLL